MGSLPSTYLVSFGKFHRLFSILGPKVPREADQEVDLGRPTEVGGFLFFKMGQYGPKHLLQINEVVITTNIYSWPNKGVTVLHSPTVWAQKPVISVGPIIIPTSFGVKKKQWNAFIFGHLYGPHKSVCWYCIHSPYRIYETTVYLAPGARVRPSTKHWVSYQPTIGYLTNRWFRVSFYGFGFRV